MLTKVFLISAIGLATMLQGTFAAPSHNHRSIKSVNGTSLASARDGYWWHGGDEELLAAHSARKMCGYEHPEVDPMIQDELQPMIEHNYALLKNGSKPHYTKRGSSIPVIFHIIYGGVQGSNVPDAQIHDQMAALNRDFANYGFSFELAKVTRSNNALWEEEDGYSGQGGDPGVTAQMEQSLLVLPDLKVQRALANGGLSRNAEGKVLSHEFGHAFGLPHPFDRGCQGTEIRDTPPEAYPASGCPVGRDSCPGGGADMVHNQMDYSDDPCRYEFTQYQTAVMHSVAHMRGM